MSAANESPANVKIDPVSANSTAFAVLDREPSLKTGIYCSGRSKRAGHLQKLKQLISAGKHPLGQRLPWNEHSRALPLAEASKNAVGGDGARNLTSGCWRAFAELGAKALAFVAGAENFGEADVAHWVTLHGQFHAPCLAPRVSAISVLLPPTCSTVGVEAGRGLSRKAKGGGIGKVRYEL